MRRPAAAFAGGNLVLDGEVPYLGDQGRYQFYDLLRRRAPVSYVAFDLLAIDGRDLRCHPLIDRKRQFKQLVARSGTVLYARHIEQHGTEFSVCSERDPEGIVANWRRGASLDGATNQTTWLKMRNLHYSQAEGRAELFQKRAATTPFEWKKS